MKIAVIGGNGLIGSQLVELLRARGHEALPASPRSGVNSLTGDGLSAALRGASVVVDVTNPASLLDAGAFFEASTRNLLRESAAAGVQHFVALTIVGVRRVPDSAYFRAKVVQERLIVASGIPYSLVSATQFFDFVSVIAEASAVAGEVRVPPAYIQPVASADVAEVMAETALGAPLNGALEIAGPDKLTLQEAVRLSLQAKRDPRAVVVRDDASFFGVKIAQDAIVPREGGARLGLRRFADWSTGGGR